MSVISMASPWRQEELKKRGLVAGGRAECLVIPIDEHDFSKGFYVVAGAHLVDAFYLARKQEQRGGTSPEAKNVDATEDGGFPCSILMFRSPKDVILYFKDTGNILNQVTGTTVQITEGITSIPEVEESFYAYRSKVIAGDAK